MTSTNQGDVALSIPARGAAPRPLTESELLTMERVADSLVPRRGEVPAASEEPEFRHWLGVALDARDDAFDIIIAVLGRFDRTPPEDLFARLETLDATEPDTFQALSTVIAGAWLLTPSVRDRIGYRGQQSDKAGLEEAVDEISSGILDPVIERDETSARWIR